MSDSMALAEVGRNACRQIAELVQLEDYDTDDSIDDIQEINNNAKLFRNERGDPISSMGRAGDERAPANKFQFDENRKSFAAFDTLVSYIPLHSFLSCEFS